RRHPRREARLLGRPRGVPPRRTHRRPDRAAAEPRVAPAAQPEPMSTGLQGRPVETEVPGGGMAARRAMVRWAWRLFRREWRQQLLVLALIIVAVVATVLGAGIGTNTPPPANAGFGTANHLVTLPG